MMRPFNPRIVSLAFTAMLAACASRPAARPSAPMSDSERALAVESFDVMWTTVRDRHYDPNLGGVDWEAVKAEFRPKVESAATRGETVALMNQALDRLGKSHFGIIPSEAYTEITGEDSDEDAPRRGEGNKPSDRPDGEIGIDVRAVDGEALVVSVDPDSPAARAGIRPGWIIDEVNGRRLARGIAKILSTYEGEAKRDGMASYAMRRAVMGHVGEKMRIKARDERGRTRALTLEAVEISGSLVTFGHLPPMHLEYRAERLPSGVGYIGFSIFFDPATIMPWYRARIAEFSDAPGIIIDLRGNPGGIGGMSMGMGNMLVSAANLKLGTMSTRDTTINFVLSPQAGRFEGPVAVLVDELSMSTSEILAGGLQGIGRARIFGVPTPGMALPSHVIKLPSGDGFQYAVANYVSADGRVLEGQGVIPDEVVRPSRKALLEGHDPVLEAAERWILGGANPSGS